MGFVEVLLIAVGLSMDAFAAAVCKGLAMPKLRVGQAAVIALSFGGTIPQFSAYIAQNFGPAHLQSNLGMTATVFIVTGFSGPFAGGCLYSLTGSYQVAILTAACLAIPGALAVLRAPGKNR